MDLLALQGDFQLLDENALVHECGSVLAKLVEFQILAFVTGGLDDGVGHLEKGVRCL